MVEREKKTRSIPLNEKMRVREEGRLHFMSINIAKCVSFGISDWNGSHIETAVLHHTHTQMLCRMNISGNCLLFMYLYLLYSTEYVSRIYNTSFAIDGNAIKPSSLFFALKRRTGFSNNVCVFFLNISTAVALSLTHSQWKLI